MKNKFKEIILFVGFIVLILIGIFGMYRECPPGGCNQTDEVWNPAYDPTR